MCLEAWPVVLSTQAARLPTLAFSSCYCAGSCARSSGWHTARSLKDHVFLHFRERSRSDLPMCGCACELVDGFQSCFRRPQLYASRSGCLKVHGVKSSQLCDAGLRTDDHGVVLLAGRPVACKIWVCFLCCSQAFGIRSAWIAALLQTSWTGSLRSSVVLV